MKRKASTQKTKPPQTKGLDAPHAWILETLARTLSAKDGLKRNHDPEGTVERRPCTFVGALKSDRMASDISTAFTWRFRHHPKGLPAAIGFAWVAVSPQGSRYFMFHWNRMDKHTLPLFEEFCRESGRPYGLLGEDLMCEVRDERFSFLDCTLIHQDDFLADVPRHTKRTRSEKIVDTANRLLARKAGQRETVDEWEFFSDVEAHDEDLQQRYHSSCVKKVKAYQKELTKEFGEPYATGTAEHRDIPCCGVVQFAAWKVRRNRLYLAGCHEDVGLSVTVEIGTD